MAWPIFAPEETVRRMACSIDGAEIMTERIVKLVDALKEEVSAEEQNVLGQIQLASDVVAALILEAKDQDPSLDIDELVDDFHTDLRNSIRRG